MKENLFSSEIFFLSLFFFYLFSLIKNHIDTHIRSRWRNHVERNALRENCFGKLSANKREFSSPRDGRSGRIRSQCLDRVILGYCRDRSASPFHFRRLLPPRPPRALPVQRPPRLRPAEPHLRFCHLLRKIPLGNSAGTRLRRCDPKRGNRSRESSDLLRPKSTTPSEPSAATLRSETPRDFPGGGDAA